MCCIKVESNVGGWVNEYVDLVGFVHLHSFLCIWNVLIWIERALQKMFAFDLFFDLTIT